MNAGRFTPEQALAIVPPVCEALQYAHEHGIVHRDIKPENVLRDKEGRVKIAEFGIAKPPSRKVQIDVRLDAIVLRALEPKPELRFQTAAEMSDVAETIGNQPRRPMDAGRAQSNPGWPKWLPWVLLALAIPLG